jgi:hypothetical protein
VNFAGRLGPEQFWAHIDELADQIRAVAHLMPLYGVTGWTGQVMTGDWQWHDDQLELAELAHGDPVGDGVRVAVATSTEAPFLDGPPGHEHPDAPTGPARITVDGQPVDVTCRRDDQAWSATGRLADHHLRIQARGVTPDQLSLTRVTDIEPYLTGYRSYLRALRGGI